MRAAILLFLFACIGCYDSLEPPPKPRLVFSAYTRGVTVGAAITPTIQVQIQDGTGLASNATDVITISISNDPGGGTLSGARTVAAVNGVATFPNLSIDKQGEGYTLTAEATGLLPAFSSPFNVACTCWSSKAPMPTGRQGMGVGVANGVLYAIGGFSIHYTATGGYSSSESILATVEAYDPVANSWTTKAPMATSRYNLAVGVVNGVVYAVGGAAVPAYLTTVEAYDPAANSWTTKAPMLAPRENLAVGVVNGVLYAVGGDSGAAIPVGTTEAYDPSTNSWTTKASMPTPRYGLAVDVVNGVLYAVGGIGGGNTLLGTVEAYDPSTNSWTTKVPVPTPRANLAAGVVNGVLYAVGGYSADHMETVGVYDPAANGWTTRGPLLTSRYGLAVGVVNRVLYAVGGLTAIAPALATLEAYDPAQDH